MDAGSHYHLWTIQMSSYRLAKIRDIHFVNITVKSGVVHFGPDWETLMRKKRGQCSDEEYVCIYLEKMKLSRLNHRKTWLRLLLYNRMAFGCYCKAGDFCHRLTFVQEAKDFIESEGGTVTLHGELTNETLPPLAT